jgi:gamma-glutamyltranspeptidase / glutathione hydrolase
MPGQLTMRPELQGSFGMVASTHWLASAAGMRMLERGGNAFDAAVAAGFALQVVEPHMNGLGGEVPVIFATADGDVRVLCGQGVAPAGATIERFADLGLDMVPGTGLLAACVPGALDAWMLLLRDYGTMGVGDVLEVAIGYADDGIPVLPRLASTIAGVERLFREHWVTSAELYLAGGVPRAGARLRNPVLAETYRRLVRAANAVRGGREAGIEAARDAFYRGFVAEAIDAFVRTPIMDDTGRAHAGLLTASDLAGWSATYEDPVQRAYHGLTVCKTGPWGQGPVLLQQLALLEGFDLQAMGHGSAEYVHTIVEAAKLAFADRDAWYGDPDHVDVPLETLLSTAYNDERRALIGADASFEHRPGSPDERRPALALGSAAADGAGVGEPTLQLGDTCHVDVVDRHGNVVSATPSGGWLQSSPVIPSVGFALGTRAQMFWLRDDMPSALGPGRRPRTTLTPSLASRDGQPYMAFGTPGGDQQDQWSLPFLLSHVDFRLNLQEAIEAPAFHTSHMVSSFYPRVANLGRLHVESRIGDETIAGLRARGHDVQVEPPWSLGRLCAASRSVGVLRAAANPRGMQGYAVGR